LRRVLNTLVLPGIEVCFFDERSTKIDSLLTAFLADRSVHAVSYCARGNDRDAERDCGQRCNQLYEKLRFYQLLALSRREERLIQLSAAQHRRIYQIFAINSHPLICDF